MRCRPSVRTTMQVSANRQGAHVERRGGQERGGIALPRPDEQPRRLGGVSAAGRQGRSAISALDGLASNVRAAAVHSCQAATRASPKPWPWWAPRPRPAGLMPRASKAHCRPRCTERLCRRSPHRTPSQRRVERPWLAVHEEHAVGTADGSRSEAVEDVKAPERWEREQSPAACSATSSVGVW